MRGSLGGEEGRCRGHSAGEDRLPARHRSGRGHHAQNGRFTAASLGSTVFGVIMDSAGGDHSGYRLCYGILIAVALAAVMLALSVPAARETAPRLARGV
jgi:hypothetical protein